LVNSKLFAHISKLLSPGFQTIRARYSWGRARLKTKGVYSQAPKGHSGNSGVMRMIEQIPISNSSGARCSGSLFAFKNRSRVVGRCLPAMVLALFVILGAPLLAQESDDVGRGLAKSSIQGVLTVAGPDGQSATLGSRALSTLADAQCPHKFDQLGAGSYRCESRAENSQPFVKTLVLEKSESRVESTRLQPKRVGEEGEGPGQELSQRSWTLEVWTGIADGLYLATSGTHVWFTGVRVGKILTREHGKGLFRGDLEYAFDIIPAAVAGKSRETYGGGFNAFAFKWNLTPRKRIAPFLEIAGGCLFTRAEVPPGTSDVNFTAQGGPGLRILLHGSHAITVAVKFFHMSNAYLARTNPGVNGLHLTIGHQWSW